MHWQYKRLAISQIPKFYNYSSTHLFIDKSRKLINWNYGRCALDLNPHDFGPFEALVSLWQQKRTGSALPFRSDFDFYDFKGWWGKIAIVKFENDPFDVRFTLWGTDLTEWWGVDYTNKLLGEQSISPDLWKSVEGKYFEAMVANPFIGLVNGQLDQHDRPHRKIVGVDLPLSDGENVTQAILAHLQIDENETVESVIPDIPVIDYF